jgi:hypothetical protein
MQRAVHEWAESLEFMKSKEDRLLSTHFIRPKIYPVSYPHGSLTYISIKGLLSTVWISTYNKRTHNLMIIDMDHIDDSDIQTQQRAFCSVTIFTAICREYRKLWWISTWYRKTDSGMLNSLKYTFQSHVFFHSWLCNIKFYSSWDDGTGDVSNLKFHFHHDRKFLFFKHATVDSMIESFLNVTSTNMILPSCRKAPQSIEMIYKLYLLFRIGNKIIFWFYSYRQKCCNTPPCSICL